jgi:hypothetical protein
MATYPKSPKETTKGMMYFPRMLDKIRLHLGGELHDDYQENFGALKAADGVCCNFLRVHHRDLIERVKQGGTDEEILQWCFEKGRRLNEGDLFVWNGICIEARLARFDHAASRRTKKTNENRRSRRHSFQTSSISTRADSRKRARLREFIELRLAASSRRSDWSLLSGFQLLQLRRPNHIGSDPKGAGATAWRLDVG